MIGMLLWKPPGKREKAVQVRERSILHTRFFCAEITRGPKTPEVACADRISRRWCCRRIFPTWIN